MPSAAISPRRATVTFAVRHRRRTVLHSDKNPHLLSANPVGQAEDVSVVRRGASKRSAAVRAPT